jgi:hypothetical protein
LSVEAFAVNIRFDNEKTGGFSSVIFLAGCNSQEQLEKQWLGRNKSMLIAMRGTPEQVMSDGFGGEIYTYIKIHYSTYPETFGYHYGRPFYSHGRHYGYHSQWIATGSSRTMFWIDPFDKIYRVSIAD